MGIACVHKRTHKLDGHDGRDRGSRSALSSTLVNTMHVFATYSSANGARRGVPYHLYKWERILCELYLILGIDLSVGPSPTQWCIDKLSKDVQHDRGLNSFGARPPLLPSGVQPPFLVTFSRLVDMATSAGCITSWVVRALQPNGLFCEEGSGARGMTSCPTELVLINWHLHEKIIKPRPFCQHFLHRDFNPYATHIRLQRLRLNITIGYRPPEP